jgi:hypothetical protein
MGPNHIVESGVESAGVVSVLYASPRCVDTMPLFPCGKHIIKKEVGKYNSA